MTPLHALIAAGALVAVGAGVIFAVALRAAGDNDDRHGRPRG